MPLNSLRVALLSGFDKRFRGHTAIPQAYELAARVLVQGLNRRDMAQHEAPYSSVPKPVRSRPSTRAGASPARRFAVHRNNVVAGLISALQARFRMAKLFNVSKGAFKQNRMESAGDDELIASFLVAFDRLIRRVRRQRHRYEWNSATRESIIKDEAAQMNTSCGCSAPFTTRMTCRPPVIGFDSW